ncbi:MAG: hypothetical protein KGL53_02645, partial [Elusimicrobia bacterium]|nr:hypothetical protein [Elusimicrobiota bacterium]
MRRTYAGLLLAAGLCLAAVGRAEAGPTMAEVWNDVFSADEQRVIYALTADPAADAELKAGLQRVIASDPAHLEADKRAFQVEWLGKIQSFAASYQAGQGRGGAKPSAAQARQQVPWLADIDHKDWGDQLTPLLISRMDPYELGYSIAHLRSLAPEDKATMVSKLSWAKTLHYSASSVVDEMVKAGREDMAKVLGGLSQDTPARLSTARQQLEAANKALAAIVKAPAASAAAGGSPVFDGA